MFFFKHSAYMPFIGTQIPTTSFGSDEKTQSKFSLLLTIQVNLPKFPRKRDPGLRNLIGRMKYRGKNVFVHQKGGSTFRTETHGRHRVSQIFNVKCLKWPLAFSPILSFGEDKQGQFGIFILKTCVHPWAEVAVRQFFSVKCRNCPHGVIQRPFRFLPRLGAV